MTTSIRFLLAWVALSGALTTGCGSHSSDDSSVEVVAPEEAFSAITLTDIEGNQFKLGDPDNRGVLFIFASHTCPIANAYVPRINQAYQEYSPRGVQFFLVQVDPNVPTDELRRHAKEFNVQPSVIHDQDHALVKRASATVTPQAVLFDPHGNIVYSGRIDDQYVDFGVKRRQPSTHDLVNALDAFLAGEEVSPKTTQAVGCYIGDLTPNR